MEHGLTPEEETTKQTYDAHAVSWSVAHSAVGFWASEMDRFAEWMGAGRVLEIGSGAGRDAAELIERGYDYVGVDVSVGLLEVARRANPGAVFLEQSVYELDFPARFDGFWCSCVLLHVPKRRIGEALGAICGSVKPGGVGFIALKEGEGEVMEPGAGNGSGRFFAYWREEEFAEVLRGHGFEVLKTSARKAGAGEPRFLCFWVKVVAR